MNSVEILFKTSRFNLSEVGEHFINPCCFGEDLAVWLREKLLAIGVDSGEPCQEDWGWEFKAKNGGNYYFLGMGGDSCRNGFRKECRGMAGHCRKKTLHLAVANQLRQELDR